MSHLLVFPSTVVSNIPLTRRILEIMKEKGKYYTISAMAGRIGIHRETYRHMLKGEREIYTFELEKIAHDLKISVQRLTQEDIKRDVAELNELFYSLSNNRRALEIAQSILSVAVGETEKCDAHTLVGRAYFELREYEMAHDHRMKAYYSAKHLQEKYGDTDRLHDSLKFLLASYTVRKDYENSRAIVEEVREVFVDHPMRFGFLSYTLGMIAYDLGNYEEARLRLIQALDSFKETDNVKEIGRAEHNVGFIEFKLGNYDRAKEIFKKAIVTLNEFLEPRLISIKDYVKVLLKLGEIDRAKEMVEKSFEDISVVESQSLKTKFLLLRSMVNDEPNDADYVLSQATTSQELKVLACRFLMNHYSKKNDALLLMKYYKYMESILNDSTLFDEGDL